MRSEGARRTERWREERHANMVHAGRDRRARASRIASIAPNSLTTQDSLDSE